MSFRKMWYTVLCMATLGLAGCGGEQPAGLGLTDGRLAPCPDSPNCASSTAKDSYQAMEPIPLDRPASAAQTALLAILQGMEGITIVSESPGYIRAEAKSNIFGFVDDVEFAVNERAGVVDFRSASRLGHGDMGANRKRIEGIVSQYQEFVVSRN